MLRTRVVGTLVLAVALLAAACSEEAPEPSTVETPAVQEEGSAPSTSDTDAEPSSDVAAAPGDEDLSDASSAGDEGTAAAGSDDPDDIVETEDTGGTDPTDAAALLATATTQLDGRSVRGEATVEVAPGFELSTSFESDTEGDFLAIFEVLPGLDPEFPGGADAEVRYVGGVAYVRPPSSPATLAELGVDEAWYVAEPAPGANPMNDAMESAGGVLCAFPQMLADTPSGDCDLLGETGTFLEAANGAEIVGREDLRGVETTRVRFLVSLLDLAGEDLGIEPDDGDTSEGGAFDDTASDPFAEGMEQIFGFLDAEFEVEVWIDDESLIRRLSFDLASVFAGIAGPEAAAEMPSSLITLEFYDYDADISVEAPPPEVIVDDPDLLVGGDDYATSEEFEPEYDDDYN